MRKTIVLLITVSMLLALFGCASKKPASSNQETSVSSETTEPITIKDGSEFFNLVPGVSTMEDVYELISGYEFNNYVDFRHLMKIKCSNRSVYIEYVSLYDENDQWKTYVVTSVSDTYPSRTEHDRATLEKITVGMSHKEVITILGEEGWCETSGVVLAEYLCDDGTTMCVLYMQDLVHEISWKETKQTTTEP